MANLGTWTLKNDNEYHTLADITGLTIAEGAVYTIQMRETAFVREGEAGEGILISQNERFQYTANTDALYIKPLYGGVKINVSN